MRVARRSLFVLPSATLLALSLAACAPSPDTAPGTTPEAAPPAVSEAPVPPATEPSAETPAPAVPGDATAPCKAEAVQSFIGREASQSTIAEAKAAAGAGNVRVIKPGQPVTMDYSAERLNLKVDDGNVIASVHCG